MKEELQSPEAQEVIQDVMREVAHNDAESETGKSLVDSY